VNVYGGVPPPAVEVQVNGLLLVAAAQLREFVTAWPPTVTVASELFLTELKSVTVLLIT